MANAQVADLVMEGGGVKGIGLVGAVTVLAEQGYQFRRLAGTSAGAIVGALTAAGMPPDQMVKLMRSIDYRNFQDEGIIDRLGIVGKATSFLFEKGVYEGKFLKQWLTAQLEDLGVKTFGDLKLTETWANDLPPVQRYKLVVIVADVTLGKLVRLPWDYTKYGLDADKQSVAEAVRASMSIPFFYEPVKFGNSLFVDGGTLSNFPIALFDDRPIWPTFGIKLSAKPEANMAMSPATGGPLSFARSIITTMMSAHDQMHLDEPCVLNRTMFVDTLNIKSTDFGITRQQQDALFENGRRAATKFLSTWNFSEYLTQCS